MQLHVGVPTAQLLLKTVKLWCVKYAEQKQIQNHPLKIRVRKIRGGRKLREQIWYLNIYFHENPSSGSHEMTNLIVPFRNFANDYSKHDAGLMDKLCRQNTLNS